MTAVRANAWHYPTKDFCAAETRLNFLHDQDNDLGPDQALNKLRGQPLGESPQNIHYGYTKGTVWLYLTTQFHEEWQKCILELGNPQLDRVVVYQNIDAELKEIATMGDFLPFSERFYRVRNYVFPFRADGNHEFLISLQSTATMTVPIKVQWRDLFVNDGSLDYLLLGLFYGLMIFFIFFGLHSFISFRSKAYLLYSAFALSMLLFFVDRDGIAYQFLWPNSTEWKLRSVRVFAAISMGLGVLYFTYILRLRSRAVLAFSYGYAGLCVLLVIGLLVLDPAITNVPTILIGAITPFAMVALPLVAMRKKRIFAPYMLAAGLCSLLGFIVYSLSVTDFIPSNYFTENALKLSTLTEFFFLTLGLHEKIKQSHRKQADHKAVYLLSNMVTHDLKKPFDMIDKFLNRIGKLREEQIPHYVESNAKEIRDNIQAANEMMLDLSEIGRTDRPAGETRLASIIPQICNGRYHCELSYDGTVRIDDYQLRRVLINITRNAQEATAGNGGCEFWISTHDEGKFVRIEIGNSGSMISQDNLQQIFDFRFTSGKRHGNGIGLSVVERAATVSGGRVWAESNGHTSSGRKIKHPRSGDYVIFHLKLLKGGRDAK